MALFDWGLRAHNGLVGHGRGWAKAAVSSKLHSRRKWPYFTNIFLWRNCYKLKAKKLTSVLVSRQRIALTCLINSDLSINLPH